MYADSPALLFDRLASENPQATAIVGTKKVWTRTEIAGFASRTASRLDALGVGRGDRIALMRRNSALHLLGTLAAMRLGAVVVPLNFRLSGREVAQIAADAQCSVLICGPHHAAELELIREQLPGLILVVDDMDPTGDIVSADLPSHWLRYSKLPGGEVDRPSLLPVTVDRDELAILQYTSGSTGTPKGVQMSYGNIWASWTNLDESLGSCAEDINLTVAPFGHVGGMNTFSLQTLVAGGTVVIQRRFDVALALELIERERVTTIFGVPTMYEVMARHPDFARRDLSSLRAALVGGACTSLDLLNTYWERGVPMCQSWGMTETCGGNTLVLPTQICSHGTSVGQSYPRSEIRLVDPETGTEVSVGTPGEILVRGANVTSGYWGRKPIEADGFLPDGWFRTGDLATQDADGYVYMRGRLKDLIISGGENIYPVEIERQICLHPDVADCAIVGIPDPQWGEAPVAVVVLRPGKSTLSFGDLQDHLKGRLARYKFPRCLLLVTQFPLGSSGKIDRAELRRLALEHCAVAKGVTRSIVK